MDMDAVAKISEESGIKIDASIFSEQSAPEGNDASVGVDSEAEEGPFSKEIKDERAMASLMSSQESFEDKLKRLQIDRDDISDMILQLSDQGYIEENIAVLGGTITATFRTSKMRDSRQFVETFDQMDISTRVKTEYYINLFALGSVLIRYKDHDLSDLDIIERIRWIEDNLAAPIYKALLNQSSIFLEKTELLTDEQVARFF